MNVLLNKEKNRLNNKGFETAELIVIIAILAIIILIGIIIGSIIGKRKPEDNGIVTISYNANGGTGEMNNSQCRTANKCILKNNMFKKEGYEFTGWSKSENEETPTYEINDTYTANSDATLYATWKLKEITIFYNANGGTGEMEPTKYTYGKDKVKISENKFEKPGYNFNRWIIYNSTLNKWYGCIDDNKTCTGTEENTTLGWHNRNEITNYYENTNEWDSKNTEYDITYYAQWGENTYEIKYQLNGGTIGKEAPVSGVYGSTVTISNPTKEGFKFTGWTVAGTDAKLENDKLTIGTSNITLTAIWTAKAYDYIQYLYNDSTLRNNNSLIKDNTSDKNIRYAGSSPNNYVSFNNELWRIIGVFNVSNGTTTSKRIKLVRNDTLIDASWDTSNSSINNGCGINEWSQSSMMKILNDYYAGNSSSCTYCIYKEFTPDGKCKNECNKNCNSKISKLSNNAKNMIEDAIWYLGAIQMGGEADGENIISIQEAYNLERGNRNGRQCYINGTDGHCTDTINRTQKWKGIVGLIYPSDYGFAGKDSNCSKDLTYNKSCGNNNWLNNGDKYWTITARDSNYFANAGWYINPKGNGCYDTVVSDNWGIRPSVYLKSNVTILSGDGTSSNPYKLGI